MNIKINKLSEHTGAEVFGVDLKSISDQRVINELTKEMIHELHVERIKSGNF